MAASISTVAIFVDTENVPAERWDNATEHLPALRSASIKRAYGNEKGIQNWSKLISDHCFLALRTPAWAEKENATDFALQIDCLELLHNRRFTEAIIISSDADFAQLAMHIRSYGARVTGVGEKKAPLHYRKVFHRFVDCSMPPIDQRKLVELFNLQKEVSPGGVVRLSAFGKALKTEFPDYQKQYGKAQKFLEASGLFSIQDGIVTLFAK
jgi:hypothetical protein